MAVFSVEAISEITSVNSGCAKSETELNIKGIYQEMASELAWCLGFNENDSKCYEMNGVKNEQI